MVSKTVFLCIDNNMKLFWFPQNQRQNVHVEGKNENESNLVWFTIFSLPFIMTSNNYILETKEMQIKLGLLFFEFPWQPFQ